jgi:hypothetical protein
MEGGTNRPSGTTKRALEGHFINGIIKKNSVTAWNIFNYFRTVFRDGIL